MSLKMRSDRRAWAKWCARAADMLGTTPSNLTNRIDYLLKKVERLAGEEVRVKKELGELKIGAQELQLRIDGLIRENRELKNERDRLHRTVREYEDIEGW
jgi:chromosome segregation ATPase